MSDKLESLKEGSGRQLLSPCQSVDPFADLLATITLWLQQVGIVTSHGSMLGGWWYAGEGGSAALDQGAAAKRSRNSSLLASGKLGDLGLGRRNEEALEEVMR